MDTYNQAQNQSIQNFNLMKNAIQPQQPGMIETYIKSGVSLRKFKESGKLGFLGAAGNFLGGVVQDIANIPSNLIGGTIDIAQGNTWQGLGRLGQGGLDLATTIFTGGTGKVATKGIQKSVLGAALGGIEGAALKKAGSQILTKEVGKATLGGAGIGAAYGIVGGLRDLDKVPENQRTDFLMGQALTGGGIGGLTGGLIRYGAVRNSINDFNRIEQNVLKDIATKNYDELVSMPLDKQGRYTIDLVDEDLKKASLQAVAGKKQGWIMSMLKPVKGLGANMENAFVDWVNTRSSTGAYALLRFKEFRNYVDNGIQGILDFEKDASKFPGVKQYFDNMYNTLVKAGILKQGQYFDEVNYLPFLFDNTNEEIAAAFEKKRRLSRKPSFTFERVIQGYNEGVELGLKPKFNNIAELVQWYDKTARKAIADTNFFRTLLQNKWVMPSTSAPKEWVTLGEGFPQFQSKVKGTDVIQTTYKAPPEFAEIINNYLAAKDKGVLAGIGKFYDGVKQRLLTAGIPFTGINFHGFSTLMRYTFGSGKNPFTSVAQGLYFMINPNAALRRIEKSLEDIPDAISSGLVISEKAPKLTLYTKKQLEKEFEQELKQMGYGDTRIKVAKLWNLYKEIVEDPLMEKVIPAYKMETWRNTYNTYKAYMPDKVAKQRAAEFTNNLLGGLNYDAMGRSNEMRNILKFFLLAPDWFETNATIAKRIGQSFLDKDKNYRAYRRLSVNVLGSYIFFNAINKAMSGKYMWENEPGQKFSIDTGTKDEQGNTRYIQAYGTGVDFLRLPVDIVDGLVNDDTAVISRLARNRLSPLGSTLVSFFSNSDYAGRPIFGTDKFGNPLSAEQVGFGISSLIGQAIGIPTILGEPVRNLAEGAITGKSVPLERTLVEAVDLPVRYKAQVSDITKLSKQRTEDRRALEDAITNGDLVTAQNLSKNFTQREIDSIVSNLTSKDINSQLTTREKLFNRLSEGQKIELARTNPEFGAMYQKISALEAQKETNPLNRFKDILQGKPAVKAAKPKRPRRLRARKVSAKVRKARIKKIKTPTIKKLQNI
jgi:hypothetical protein